MKKEQKLQQMADNVLDVVTGGGKTIYNVDDTKPVSGGLVLEIDGELVTLYDNGEDGFEGIVKGKERKFSYAEIAEMLRQVLQG